MATTDPHAHDHDHHHDHGHHHHGHNHPHDPIEVSEGASEYEIMVHAIKELLIEKGVITGEDIRKTLEFMDTRTPALGAKVVARAWSDPEFKKRLIANGTSAVAEMGIPMGDAELIVVENSNDVHNVIVCTLCSCYPRTVLGLPPDWYKSRNYRSRVVAEPRAVLKEFGTELPDSVTLRTHDSNADMRYLVLPERPAGTEGWSQDRLAAIVTRDCMVGVALPKAG
ncbi:MAG TPA: nitrile hydratase subunit alpha [Xanthobacteraceae bacterium]|jgi:nitrile hydratase alpha subunit|nr:nitrile hydratase subunit alpha [Xanthobacteraceae bacterium]